MSDYEFHVVTYPTLEPGGHKNPGLHTPRRDSRSRNRHMRQQQLNDAAASFEALPTPSTGSLVSPALASFEKVLFPLLFAALKAIIVAIPNAACLPEIRTLLAMEPLLAGASLSS